MDFCSAPSGWLRQKAQCVSVWVFVCLRVSATLSKKIKVWNQMMAQHCHHPGSTLFSTVIVVSVDHLTASTVSTPLFWCSAAFWQSLPHFMCFESPRVASCSLHPSLMIISINRTLQMYCNCYVWPSLHYSSCNWPYHVLLKQKLLLPQSRCWIFTLTWS